MPANESAFSAINERAYTENNLAKATSTGWRSFSDLQVWKSRAAGLDRRYPGKPRLPLFYREDSDDLICVRSADLTNNNWPVEWVHDYASEGWESSGGWADLQAFIEDLSEGDW